MLLTRYFTFINLVLIVFHKYTYKKINLLFTSFVCSIFGFMFFNICPGQFKVDLMGNHITVKKPWLRIADMLFHHLPLLFVLTLYLNYYRKNSFDVSFLTANLILLVYAVVNIDKHKVVYGCKDIVKILATTFVLYVIYLVVVLV
jgi:hypothetical protein